MFRTPLVAFGALSLVFAACSSAVENDPVAQGAGGSHMVAETAGGPQMMEWPGGSMSDIVTRDGPRVLSSLTAAERDKLTADAKNISLYAQDTTSPGASDSKTSEFASDDLPMVRIVAPAGTAYDSAKGTTGADISLRITPIMASLSSNNTVKEVYVQYDWYPAKGEKFSAPTPGAPDGAIQWTGWWELDANGNGAPHAVKKS